MQSQLQSSMEHIEEDDDDEEYKEEEEQSPSQESLMVRFIFVSIDLIWGWDGKEQNSMGET